MRNPPQHWLAFTFFCDFLTEVYLERQITQKDLQITTFKFGCFSKLKRNSAAMQSAPWTCFCVHWSMGSQDWSIAEEPSQALYPCHLLPFSSHVSSAAGCTLKLRAPIPAHSQNTWGQYITNCLSYRKGACLYHQVRKGVSNIIKKQQQ